MGGNLEQGCEGGGITEEGQRGTNDVKKAEIGLSGGERGGGL